MHRRIDIAEVPLVGRNLPIRVEVQAAHHQQQLLLGKVEVHQRQGNRVKSEVPGGIPRVLPFVRHGDHIAVEHVKPLSVAYAARSGLHQRMAPVLQAIDPHRNSRIACSRAFPPVLGDAPDVHPRSMISRPLAIQSVAMPLNSSVDMPVWVAATSCTAPFSPCADSALRSRSSTALNGCLFFQSGCLGASSLSNVAMRSAGETKSGAPCFVTAATNAVIACLRLRHSRRRARPTEQGLRP